MAIRSIVLRGYGNGTFNGTIALVALRGYTSAVVTTTINDALNASARDLSLTAEVRDFSLTGSSRDFGLTAS